jgi:cob(I)alamin adenosyltransferase
MPVYTKKGDRRLSSVLGGKRISKDSPVFEVLGTIDEANSFLGLAASFIEEQYLKNKIAQVQRNLFKLGSIIAGAKGTMPKPIVAKYEKEIDAWTALMPPLKNFVYPGGSNGAACLFVARSIVRRAERRIVCLPNIRNTNSEIPTYINRLGDYLFTLARYINFREGVRETALKNTEVAG